VQGRPGLNLIIQGQPFRCEIAGPN